MGSNLLGIMGEQGKNTKQIFNRSKEWIIIYVTILGGKVGKWNKTRKRRSQRCIGMKSIKEYSLPPAGSKTLTKILR